MENTDLMDLPVDILINIFVRLPAISQCFTKCVSKRLFDIIDGTAYANAQLRRLRRATKIDAQAPPQLMLFAQAYIEEGRGGLASLQTLEYDGNDLARGKHEEVNILGTLCSSFNWCKYQINFVLGNLVCLKHRNDYRRCFLINPLTGESLRLQPTTDHGRASRVDYESYGMGFDDLTNTHKILCVSQHKHIGGHSQGWLEARVLVLGTNSWRQIPSVPPQDCDFHHALQNVCAYGDMHWLVSGRRSGSEGISHIISFDFKKEEFYWTPHPTSLRWNLHLHLLTLRGFIAIVDTFLSSGTNINIEIWVLKDYDKKEWILQYTINMEMLGFGYRTCTCGEWEHGIFFKEVSNSNTRTPALFFLDLRSPVSMKPVKYPTLIRNGEDTRIFSMGVLTSHPFIELHKGE